MQKLREMMEHFLDLFLKQKLHDPAVVLTVLVLVPVSLLLVLVLVSTCAMVLVQPSFKPKSYFLYVQYKYLAVLGTSILPFRRVDVQYLYLCTSILYLSTGTGK